MKTDLMLVPFRFEHSQVRCMQSSTPKVCQRRCNRLGNAGLKPADYRCHFGRCRRECLQDGHRHRAVCLRRFMAVRSGQSHVSCLDPHAEEQTQKVLADKLRFPLSLSSSLFVALRAWLDGPRLRAATQSQSGISTASRLGSSQVKS